MEKSKGTPYTYVGPIEVDNIHSLVRIEGYEVKGDTPFELWCDNQWKRGHRINSRYGQAFMADDGYSRVIADNMDSGRITSEIPKNYFEFIKVDDFFNDATPWHTIEKMESFSWDAEAVTLTLNLLSDEGQKCAMVIQPATGSIVRLRFHPEKQAGDYTDGNTRNIVCDSFKELFQLKKDEHFEAFTKESTVKGQKYVDLKFHGSLVNQIVHVRVQYDPFTLEITREVTNPATSKTEVIPVMSTPEGALCFRYSGGFDDYHIIQSVCKSATSKYVGFGEQGGMSLLKNNTRVTYFNYDNMRYRQIYNRGPVEGREPLYHSDPFFMEVNSIADKENSCAVFVDNPSETLLDMGYYYSNMYRFGIRYGVMDYYVIAGATCTDVIKSFSNIVGNARLIPRYALGYHQGCYGYECRRDVEEAVNRYREAGVPIDGIHIDVDIQKDYKTFTIDTDKFPDPKGMFSSLRKQGIKCSTNITPIISNRNTGRYETYTEGAEKDYFVNDERYDPANGDAGRVYYKYAGGNKCYTRFEDKERNFNSGKPFIGEVYYGNDAQNRELGTTGCYPDFSRKEVRMWWGKQYEYLFDMGLEMVWQDMTTPCLRDTRGDMLSFPSRLLVNNDYIKKVDVSVPYEKAVVMKVWNLYSYNLHKATYHGLNNLKGRENKRNFIVGRGCYTGMQRFAALWTGDNSSSWDFLRINISQVLALGLTGQALSGQDIGGFEREEDWEKWADPELLIRWTSMGAFLPWFRNHYIRKGRKEFQEPYAYASRAWQAPYEERYLYESMLPICKYYIELRYTLLQLFYDATFENTLNGMPICRALFLTNPEDKALFNDKAEYLNTEFMVGKDLLVAPVLDKQSNKDSGKRDIYLPSGNYWYQFTNHLKPLSSSLQGGSMIIDYNASINNEWYHIPYVVPLFVKEGAVLPVIGLEQYIGELADKGQANPITLYVYPGAKGSYTMYLDDGVSRSSQPRNERGGVDPEAKGEYREVQIDHSYASDKKREIRIEKVHNGYLPKYEDCMYVGILHTPDEEANPVVMISVNGNKAEVVSDRLALDRAERNSCYYEASNHTTYIKLIDEDDRKAHKLGSHTPLTEVSANIKIEIEYR